MQQPRLSVIIPHLNEPEEEFRRCLVALNAQRSSQIGLEIIVVDNGSRTPPFELCSRIPDIRLLSEPTPGPGPARNLGASLAKSDLLCFVDADCVVQPGWAEAIVRTFESYPDVDVIGGDIAILPTNPGRLSAIEAYESIYSYRARLYVERHGYAATGNMAVRASVFRDVGPFGGIGTMEDTDWGQRATALSYRSMFLPRARVLTPSCHTFSELSRRWDRHVAHLYAAGKHRRLARIRWVVDSLVVATSPLIEVLRVLQSTRISGFRGRALAFSCLTRIRLYRAGLMLRLAFGDRSGALVESWNREARP